MKNPLANLDKAVVKNFMFIGIAFIPVIITFLIVYWLFSKDSHQQSQQVATVNDAQLAAPTDAQIPGQPSLALPRSATPFDLDTEQLDGFFATVLNTLGQDKTARTEVTNTNQSGRTWLTIVRKSYLKHFIPMEVANLSVSKVAAEHGLKLMDALEIRNEKEHYVRLWFGREDLHTNTIMLYPGEKAPEELKPTAPGLPTPMPGATTKAERPKLGIIIDDFGAAYTRLTQDFIDLPYKLTFAILPPTDEDYLDAPKIAKAAAQSRKEIMLHLPMEPTTFPADYPGPNALYISDPPEVQRKTVLKNLAALEPYVKGVNNHMGSRATIDEATMKVLMGTLKEKGMYFVDSKTNRESIGARIAIRNSVGTRENWFFLDPEGVDVNYVEKKLQEAADTARERGSLVVIGHISRTMLEALKNKLPDLEKQGIEFVFISQILR